MYWLDKIKWHFQKKENQLNLDCMGWALLSAITLMSFLSLLFLGFMLQSNFMSERHNIDLVVNTINRDCGYCLADHTDKGVTAYGTIGEINLENAYIGSMYRTKFQFMAIALIAFLAGFFLYMLGDFIIVMVKARFKLKEYQKKRNG